IHPLTQLIQVAQSAKQKVAAAPVPRLASHWPVLFPYRVLRHGVHVNALHSLGHPAIASCRRRVSAQTRVHKNGASPPRWPRHGCVLNPDVVAALAILACVVQTREHPAARWHILPGFGFKTNSEASSIHEPSSLLLDSVNSFFRCGLSSGSRPRSDRIS